MADSGVILGLAGIAGTLAGVTAGNATTLTVERRRLRRDEARERAESRKAARLVSTELAEAVATIATCIETGRPWSPQFAPSRAAWLEYQSLLASELTQDEYQRVSHAYVQLKADMHVASDERDAKLPDELIESLRITRKALDKAQQELHRLTRDEQQKRAAALQSGCGA